jgi:SpoOM protein
MGSAWDGSGGGVRWRLELERNRLLPGRLVGGRVTVTAEHALEARGLVVALRGEEHWRYDVSTTDSQGRSQTEIRTGRANLPPEPVMVAGPLNLAAGETRSFDLQLPVPGLGPATLEAKEAGVTWVVEAKLDIPGAMDSSIEAPVRVAQPVALLKAGVVQVGQFALYEGADARAGEITGSIVLDPVPLVTGEPFTGRLTLRPAGSLRLQEIRVEVRVKVESTVSGGRSETLTPWSAIVAPAMELSGERTIEIAGTLGGAALPTVELPHGRASAQVHVILAK